MVKNNVMFYAQDVKSPYVVEKYLKEYRQAVGKLVCRVCGISRASLIGFYAHVVICGKSEEVRITFVFIKHIRFICATPFRCILSATVMLMLFYVNFRRLESFKVFVKFVTKRT